MNMSEKINEIAPALVAAQEGMTATKDKENTFFNSKYATLDEILISIRPALKENDMTVIQTMETAEVLVTCVTRIMHKSGQFIDSTFSLKVDKTTPQGYGSAVTYARRYGLCAALSISTPDEDDDANGAEKATEKALEKDAVAAKLKRFTGSALPKFMAFDVMAVQQAFEDSGYVSDLDEQEPMVADLIKQANSIEKLTTIGLRAKELDDEITQANDTSEKGEVL